MPTAEQAINNIRVKVAAMCGLVSDMFRDGVLALRANDQKMADEVGSRDIKVDDLEVELEEMCLRFLALHAPKAFELRYAVAVSRMISDLERIADHSKAIARQVHEHYCAPILAALPDFARLTELADEMLTEACEAFFKTAVDRHAGLVKKDRLLGALQRDLNRRLLEVIAERGDSIDGAVALINVIRRLERVGDHAKAIARLAPYIADGTVMRHKDKAATCA